MWVIWHRIVAVNGWQNRFNDNIIQIIRCVGTIYKSPLYILYGSILLQEMDGAWVLIFYTTWWTVLSAKGVVNNQLVARIVTRYCGASRRFARFNCYLGAWNCRSFEWNDVMLPSMVFFDNRPNVCIRFG